MRFDHCGPQFYKAPHSLDDNPKNHTIENACEYSPLILIGEASSYEKARPISFFEPPIVHYKVVKVVKGNYSKSDIAVRYEFRDYLSTKEPVEWKYSETMLPKMGEEYILLIWVQPQNGLNETYEGSFGRIKNSPANLQKFLRALGIER